MMARKLSNAVQDAFTIDDRGGNTRWYDRWGRAGFWVMMVVVVVVVMVMVMACRCD